MAFKMMIAIPIILDQNEIDTVFEEKLKQLENGRWVRDGKVFTERYTSHRFDDDITKETSKKDIRILKAIEELREALK